MPHHAGSDSAAEAAARYARLRSGDAGEDEHAALRHWREENPAHDTAWRQVERADAALDALRDDPAIAELRAAALRAPPARSRRWLPLAAAAAVSGTIALGATALLVVSRPGQRAATPAPATRLATGIGELRTVRLADGTRVTLDAASTVLVYPPDGTRRVELVAGRALFAVARDPAHPFVVTSGAGTVTALGTHFAVECRPKGIVVALTEGSVRVTTPASARVLAPGQVLTARDATIAVAPKAAEAETGWQRGRLTFSAVPLGEVAAQLNRYTSRRLVIRNAALAAHPFSGSLRTSNGTSALIAALETYGVARVSARNADMIELAPR